MRHDCLIYITRKTHFVHILDTVADSSSSCPFINMPAVKLLAHYANTGKETLFPFIDSSIDQLLLQTNLVCTSRFLTSQTFVNFFW